MEVNIKHRGIFWQWNKLNKKKEINGAGKVDGANCL